MGSLALGTCLDAHAVDVTIAMLARDSINRVLLCKALGRPQR